MKKRLSLLRHRLIYWFDCQSLDALAAMAFGSMLFLLGVCVYLRGLGVGP